MREMEVLGNGILSWTLPTGKRSLRT